MILEIKYSIIPSFKKSSSLYICIAGKYSPPKFWYQFGGLGQDHVNDKPWWIDNKRPTLQYELIDSSYMLKLMEALGSISVEPYSECSMGHDGTIYELELIAGLNRSKFVWWCNLPLQWQQLVPLIDHLENMLNEKRGLSDSS